ncbi:unnamed protein product [Adineta steineri]|uniref:TAF6 C-terminal HEAT repeat domain-containing protein n=1 Tax=Adineta steineri TaxID=433720 RepID=A0A813QPR7_9BILA|nr:unnamed protein product [Adineta steineri]CAF0770110.1 unnamed protein product [Adineta steineri]
MFDLLRYVCEFLFGSSLALSQESFEYLSTNLHIIVIQIIQQSFLITLRSKRIRLLGDDLQLVLKHRAISPLFGYCCSSTTNKDISIKLNETTTNISRRNKRFQLENISKKCIVTCDDIIVHVEWLARAGEQKCAQIKSSFFDKSLLNNEQQLYLSFLQSKTFNKEIQNSLRYDQIAINSILSYLIEWCRNNICDCLLHNYRLDKRRQLSYYLTIIDCLLENPSITINYYLHILSPIVINCLLYEFENDNLMDFDATNKECVVNTDHIWLLRLLAARTCVKILQRSNFLIYDIFYIRIISRLVYSLTKTNTSSSIIYAILYLFEQLGCYASRTFLLPHLLDIDSSKIISSKSIQRILERIARMIVEI